MGDPAVPLRPLGVAELLDGAVRTVRRNPRPSFALALPVALAQTMLVAASTLSALDVAADGGLALPEFLLELFVGSLAATVLAGLLAPVVAEEVLGNSPGQRLGTAAALRRVGRRGWPLAVLAVLVAVALEAGVVALVVGGLWLWGLWALAAPVLVLEGLGPVASLRRSAQLVTGRFWAVWGVRALGWLVTTVLGLLFTLPFTALAAAVSDSDPFTAGGVDDRALYVTVAAVGTLLANLLLSPVAAALDTLLYVDARMRREGLDLWIAMDAEDAEDAAP